MGDGAAQLEGFITEASQGHAVEWVGGKLPCRLALSIPANAFSDKRHAWWAFFYRNHRTKLDLFFSPWNLDHTALWYAVFNLQA